jgi:type II secretory pathway component PulC
MRRRNPPIIDCPIRGFFEGYTMHPWRATIWTITLVLVAAVAYSAAITTTLLIERRLSAPRDDHATRPGLAGRARAEPGEGEDAKERRPYSDYRPILERNIFGARLSQAPAAKPRPQAGTAAPAPAPAPKEPFQATVTGTLLAGNDSFAMVIGSKGGEQVYRVGECIPRESSEPSTQCGPDQAKLLQVEMDRVVVLHEGKRLPIDVTANRTPPVAARGPEKGKKPDRIERNTANAPLSAAERRRERLAGINARRESPSQPDKNEEGSETPPEAANTFPVDQNGNRFHYSVPTAEVEKAFENFSEVASQAAAVPIIENGQPKGFQLRRIRPGSIYQRLGLRNNDLVLSVNGESLTTADQALRLFTAFRNEREITLDVRRGNQDVQLSYSVE